MLPGMHRKALSCGLLITSLACGGGGAGDSQSSETSETQADTSETTGDGDGDGDGDSPIPDDAVWIGVELDDPIAELDPRYLSIALDTDKVVSQKFDFDRPRLLALTSELAPALLRIGGTKADGVYYDLSDSPVTEPPPNYADVMDREIWDAACGFAEALGFEMLFTINAGQGPRGGEGPWAEDQARALIEYTVAQGCPVSVWELGNEVGAFNLEQDFTLAAADYAADFAVFDALLDEIDPEARNAGPASMYWPLEGEIFVPIIPGLMADSGPLVDILTWHYYPQQSSSCPVATRPVDQPIPPLFWFDTITTWAEEVEGYLDQAAPGAEVWLGETGHAQCGGEPGISDTFASSFWWLDELGQIAVRGQPLVIRQALSGGSYNLIDDATLEPAPDYYASVLWKRHMGSTVLAASLDAAPETLRAYAHCDVQAGGAVALVVINFDADNPASVAFLDGNLDFEAMVVTAEDVLATSISLNGEPFAALPEGQVPTPVVEPQRGALELPPLSYAFVRVPEAGAAACL
jgi:heparanase 1